MTRKVTSYRLPEMTLSQIKQLTESTGSSDANVIAFAIDRMFQQEKQTMKYSRRQHKIEKIADIIVGHRLTDEDIERANLAGWTIDIRFHDEQYADLNSWSRVTDIHLDSDELATAKRIAADLEATL